MSARRTWKRCVSAGVVVASLTVGASAVTAVSAGAANSTTCPLAALQKAGKPVEITMWHWMTRANETTLQKIVDGFNSSQRDVKVNLVNQVDWEATLAKYKSGLASGDLPDIVQLQETDQQQMIDTQTVLPASVCAKADKYSFSDFLPRVVSYFTVQGTQYAMPFNTSGPVLYYNKKAFTAAGLDANTPPKTLADVRTAAQKLKAGGVSAPLGLKVDPIFFEHWTAMADRLFANNGNGRKARATQATFDTPVGRQIFSWMSGMVKDGLATTNSDLGADAADDLLGIRNGTHAMAIDSSAALGTIKAVLAAGNDPNIELGVAPLPAPGTGGSKGGVFVQGGELFMVNKSSPAKQAAAWQFLKYLDQPDNITAWAIGTGYVPIRKSSAASSAMQQYWAQNPGFKVAYDQLLGGSDSIASAGSVIGDNKGVRDAVRDGENSMFLQGKDPKAALAATAQAATTAIDDYNTRIGR
ncbi:MAG: sn-glycerol 3-phosphate transport system substrate-binding protein [Actinomycetota bacterium]|jgi:sn-glycerol 3-phosphate transport system substrate-binding protein|nr:sn-glycerol 3-phosphate transport system substrate-binding protein [Actinomycetota bacterium]